MELDDVSRYYDDIREPDGVSLEVHEGGVTCVTYVAAARDAGLGVVLITHSPHHAYLVENRFVLLKRGRMVRSELDDLRHELERATR